jgi:uncharacterized membrane protein YfcA
MTADAVHIALFASIGVLSGLSAGLLGVGGGAIQMPLTVLVFQSIGLPYAHIAHIALGTAVASIVFSSFASARAHHRHARLDWDLLRGLAPGLVVGAFTGGWLAQYVSTAWLAILFAVFNAYSSAALIFDLRPAPHRGLPGRAGLAVLGAAVGLVATMVGGGGGILLMPALAYFNVPFHRTIGLGSAIGVPVALTGAVSHVLAGLHEPGLPAGSLGYVWLPALLPIVAASMLAAPIGARIAHRMPAKLLRRLFALTTLALALNMARSLVFA